MDVSPLPAGPAEYEADPGFRELIGRLSMSGLFYAGVLSLMLTALHLGVHRLALGFDLTWSYDAGLDPRTSVALWDKTVIAAFGILAIFLSRLDIASHWGRLLGAVLALLVVAAILVDDILNRDVTFTAAYFALVLLVAVNTLPYKPWHTFALGASGIGLIAVMKLYAPGLLGVTGIEIGKTQLLYMAMVVVVLTAITSLLYRYRYEQYAAQKSARALNRALEERTRALEAEKQKTDEQAQRLAEMEELKSRFFSNITHEFRTPLTLILGPTDDALAHQFGPLDPRLEAQLELVHRNGLRLQTLIDQLLDLSRVDAGMLELQMKPADLQVFLFELHQTYAPIAERKGIDFQYGSSCSELWTPFDAENLEKVLSNILSNAFKFTPKGGRVRMTLAAETAIEIHVRDTGPGLPAEELPLIFDRFHQAPGVAGDTAGSGIGLALARELVELHGGTIEAEGDVGFGTHLIVRLPYAASSRLEPLPPEPDEPAVEILSPTETDLTLPTALSERRSILVIDDNEDIRTYLRSHLQPRYEVIEAAGGRDGLELARRHTPALVISDVMMPDVDGFEVCRKLKEGPGTREIPVILLTAKTTEEAKIQGLEARADDYMFKPFSAAELLTRVENLIELRRMLWQSTSRPVHLQPSEPDVTSVDQQFLANLQAAIERHMSNTNFGVEWLADEVALSARQLQRRLQTTAGLSAAGLIRMMRLQRAAQLLKRNAGSVSEIAYAVGFQDAAYFSRLFKQTFGLTPTQYTETHPLEEAGT